MMRRIARTAVVLLAGLAAACTSEQERLPLPEREFAAMLADIHLAESINQNLPPDLDRDSVKNAYYERIFAHYGISRAQYEKAMSNIRRDPHFLNELYTEVLNELGRREAELQ